MIVNSRTTTRENREVNGECESIVTSQETTRYTLRFDGKAYVVPKVLR